MTSTQMGEFGDERSLPLHRDTLVRLPAGIIRPTFDPVNTRTGIVHLGLGGFHRAHMARYTHNLMAVRPDCSNWGICGAGLLPSDKRIHDILASQDMLYSLVERQDDCEIASIIASIREGIFAGLSSRKLLQAMDDPGVRIVSLTVTAHGYCIDSATKQLDASHPMIVHDLDSPALPRSAIGILVEAYRRRMTAGLSAFTALTCDNIQHNGMVLRSAVLAFATLRDQSLAHWIAAHASFPNTMVDRITPTTTDEDRQYLATRFRLADGWPVFSELFTQWVIEDNFAQGRPPWEEVGVQFVSDVGPYEFMKLRLLNASHLAIAGLGRLANFTHIHETLQDESIRSYMRALMDRETGPMLPPVPGVDLAAYKSQLIDRFANPKIKDTVERVNTDAPVNLLIDPLLDRMRVSANFELLALGLAAWMRRIRGVDEAGQSIQIIHPLAGLLRARATEGGPDPRPLLSITSLFGELGEHPGFVRTIERWLTALYTIGAKGALEQARRMLSF